MKKAYLVQMDRYHNDGSIIGPVSIFLDYAKANQAAEQMNEYEQKLDHIYNELNANYAIWLGRNPKPTLSKNMSKDEAQRLSSEWSTAAEQMRREFLSKFGSLDKRDINRVLRWRDGTRYNYRVLEVPYFE